MPPPLPPKLRACINSIGVCVWYGVVAWGENFGKGIGGGGGGSSSLIPPLLYMHVSLYKLPIILQIEGLTTITTTNMTIQLHTSLTRRYSGTYPDSKRLIPSPGS